MVCWQFCRIQNLHISQTILLNVKKVMSFVEFKIYISLKQVRVDKLELGSFVEFKIYISLKLLIRKFLTEDCFVEFKIYISLKPSNRTL